MKFTPNQIEFMRKRFDENKNILKYKPSEGYLGLAIEQRILHLILEIHRAGKDDS